MLALAAILAAAEPRTASEEKGPFKILRRTGEKGLKRRKAPWIPGPCRRPWASSPSFEPRQGGHDEDRADHYERVNLKLAPVRPGHPLQFGIAFPEKTANAARYPLGVHAHRSPPRSLAGLPVHCLRPAKLAVLADLEALRIVLLVLGRSVVAVLAVVAGQSNTFTHGGHPRLACSG